jgi:hypothetical protein
MRDQGPVGGTPGGVWGWNPSEPAFSQYDTNDLNFDIFKILNY